MSLWELTTGVPTFYRWRGHDKEDENPIVVSEIIRDATGRVMFFRDENGTNYNFDNVISWRVASKEETETLATVVPCGTYEPNQQRGFGSTKDYPCANCGHQEQAHNEVTRDILRLVGLK